MTGSCQAAWPLACSHKVLDPCHDIQVTYLQHYHMSLTVSAVLLVIHEVAAHSSIVMWSVLLEMYSFAGNSNSTQICSGVCKIEGAMTKAHTSKQILDALHASSGP